MEMKQQEPQKEEIPIWAMSALKISRKHRPRQHQPYDLPWGQIKTLTNRAENLVSQQGLPRSPEYILLAMLSLLACTYPSHPHPRPPPAQAGLIPNPVLFQVVKWTERGPILSTNDSIRMPPL